MNVFTYIHDAILRVLREDLSDPLQFAVGAALILILVAGLAYLVGYAYRKNQKKQEREKEALTQKRRRAGKFTKKG